MASPTTVVPAASPVSGLPPMQYARLGKTGLRVSRICLGCMSFGSQEWRQWVLPETESLPLLKKAFSLGINFYDTADVYSQGRSEEILGKAVKLYCPRRDELVIATKVYSPMGTDPAGNNRGLSRKHMMQAVNDSLRRLDMDYIDLYQIHRFDNETPIEETMETLHDLVRSGKVRYIGASSMYCYQFATMQALAQQRGWTPFVSMQNHYNLAYREEEREMNPYCASTGVGLIPWSPLARGFLTSKSAFASGPAGGASGAAASAAKSIREQSDPFLTQFFYQQEDFAIKTRLQQVADSIGLTPAQLAMTWLLAKPGVVSPIVGVTKESQLDEAVSVMSPAVQAKLTPDVIRQLEELYKPHRILGHS